MTAQLHQLTALADTASVLGAILLIPSTALPQQKNPKCPKTHLVSPHWRAALACVIARNTALHPVTMSTKTTTKKQRKTVEEWEYCDDVNNDV